MTRGAGHIEKNRDSCILEKATHHLGLGKWGGCHWLAKMDFKHAFEEKIWGGIIKEEKDLDTNGDWFFIFYFSRKEEGFWEKTWCTVDERKRMFGKRKWPPSFERKMRCFEGFRGVLREFFFYSNLERVNSLSWGFSDFIFIS